MFQPMDIIVTIDEVRFGDDPAVKRQAGVDSADHELLKRPAQPHHALVARRAVDHKLGDQAIVVGRNAVAVVQRAVYPNAKPPGAW